MAGRRTCGTSRPSLGVQVLALFSLISWETRSSEDMLLPDIRDHPTKLPNLKSRDVVAILKAPRAQDLLCAIGFQQDTKEYLNQRGT